MTEHPTTPTDDSRPTTTRILLVDDDATVRAAIRFALEAADYAVFVADNARNALATMSQVGPFDLVITDMMMPDMTGAELIRALREELREELREGLRDEERAELRELRELPAIIVSGYTAQYARTQWQIPSNVVFLEKSTAARQLLPAVKSLLTPQRTTGRGTSRTPIINRASLFAH